MDNELNSMVGQLLSDPQMAEKLSGLFGSLIAAPPSVVAEEEKDGAALAQLLPLLQGLAGGADDHEVALLRALRPYLHGGREKRVDEAIEILRLVKLLPLLTGKRGEGSHG